MKKLLLLTLTLLFALVGVACMGDDLSSQTSESVMESDSLISSEDNEDSCGNSESITSYIVTFDTNGGSEVESLSVSEGGKVQKPEDPKKSSRDGEYEFVGWLYQGEAWDFENGVVTSDITLVAEWELVAEYPPSVLPED